MRQGHGLQVDNQGQRERQLVEKGSASRIQSDSLSAEEPGTN